MFHNIAPTGLPSSSSKKNQREEQNKIEGAIVAAINELVESNSSTDQKLVFNLINSDVLAIVKALDKFFSHGLISMDKCYWSFVREMVNKEERINLKAIWNCENRRDLSLAWLKDSLNRHTLQFQMFGFISCNEEIKRTHYERGACVRNKILLKRICLLLDEVSEVEFHIEPPYVLRIEDTPIALPAVPSPIDGGTMSPVHSSSNSSLACHYLAAANLPMNIHRRRRESAARLSNAGSSFCEITRNSYLEGLVDDLPEVDLAAVTNTEETSVQSSKEQTYILDQMLRNKRKGFASYNSSPHFILDDDEEEEMPTNSRCDGTYKDESSLHSLIPDDPCTSGESPHWLMQQKEEIVEEEKKGEKDKKSENNNSAAKTTLNGKRASFVGDLEKFRNRKRDSVDLREMALLNSLAANSGAQREEKVGGGGRNTASRRRNSGGGGSDCCDIFSSSTHDEDDELMSGGIDETLLEGEIFLDSGEIIQLQLELCIKDGERIQRLFQVFTGHSAGQPAVRYILITDQFVYLLVEVVEKAAELETTKRGIVENVHNTITGTNPELGISPASVVDEGLVAEEFERNFRKLSTGEPPKKFEILASIALSDLDYLTVGIDAQVLCFHSKANKFSVSSTHSSGHALRSFVVETGSRVLGKAIVLSLRRTMANRIALETATEANAAAATTTKTTSKAAESSSSTTPPPEQKEEETTIKPLNIDASLLSSHFAFVIKRFLARELGPTDHEIKHMSLVYWQQTFHQQRQSIDASSSLECFLFVREVHQRSWNRKTVGEWQQCYLVLRGSMYYQFSDSTFKFAQRKLNLRDSIEEVFRIDLATDEKYVFQVTFSRDVVEGGGGLYALQFDCPNVEVLNRWIGALSLALYVSSENPPPVACMAILTGTHLVFAQEGLNCAVDGFMRGLSSLCLQDAGVAEFFAVHTDFNTALMIRRSDRSSDDDWLLFRERSEMDRLLRRLREQFKLAIVVCGAVAGEEVVEEKINKEEKEEEKEKEEEEKKYKEEKEKEENQNQEKGGASHQQQHSQEEQHKLVLECAQMPNLWRTIPHEWVE